MIVVAGCLRHSLSAPFRNLEYAGDVGAVRTILLAHRFAQGGLSCSIERGIGLAVLFLCCQIKPRH